MTDTVAYPFVLRPVTPADREAVVELARAIDPDDYVPDAIDYWIGQTPPCFFVVEQDGRAVGCHATEWPAPGEVFLFAMRVHPGMQGRGIGSLYCQAQIDLARREGARTIYLTSLLENYRAHHIVEKNGYIKHGPVLVYQGDVPGDRPLQSHRARRATAEDLPGLAVFRQGLAELDLSDIIASHENAWAQTTMTDGAWNLEDTVVVEGEAGLEGVMLLRFAGSPDEPTIFVRRLEGTPEAAADLLGFAAQEGARRGVASWEIGLPMRCEPLLAPLGLDPQKFHRYYVFRLHTDRAL